MEQIKEDHHLTRYDTEPTETEWTHGYWTFLKIIQGQKHYKKFEDKEFGGEEGSHIAAQKYRDTFLQKHGFTPRARKRDLSDAHLKRHNVCVKVKSKGRHYWLVQIWHNGVQNGKTFADKTFGSEGESKKAAIEYRDKFIRENKIDISTRYHLTDTPGVHKTYSLDKRGQKCWYYQVTWYEGKSRSKRFSVRTDGGDEARRKAIIFREQLDRQLQNGGSTAFLIPADQRIKIWRYMDFTKFVYAIDKSALFFTRIDSLEDPYEGSYSRANTWMRKLAYSKAKEQRTMEDVLELIREARKNIFVNCWHMNEGESAAMWRLYARTNEAICIQSTYEQIAACMPPFVNIGMVNYIDYEKDWIPEDNIYNPFLFKRQSFAHERELRAIIHSKDEETKKALKYDDNGVVVNIDLCKLIQRIYVSPEAPDWFFDLVCDVSAKYGIDKKVYKSSLDTEPLK